MSSTGVQTQISPPASHVIALRIRAVESQQEKGFLHHFGCLERYRQPRVFMWDRFRGVRRKIGIRRFREYDDVLRFLMPDFINTTSLVKGN